MNIKIKDTMYRILKVDSNHEEINDYYFGKTDLYHKIIWLDKNYVNIKEVLYHEITHAIIFEYGFENIKWNEEQVCIFISKYISQLGDIKL